MPVCFGHVERSSRQDNARQYFLFGLDKLAERELSRRASNKRVGRSLVEDEACADDAVNPGRERIVSAARQRFASLSSLQRTPRWPLAVANHRGEQPGVVEPSHNQRGHA